MVTGNARSLYKWDGQQQDSPRIPFYITSIKTYRGVKVGLNTHKNEKTNFAARRAYIGRECGTWS